MKDGWAALFGLFLVAFFVGLGFSLAVFFVYLLFKLI